MKLINTIVHITKKLKSSLLVSRRAHILNLNTQNWSVFFVSKKKIKILQHGDMK